MSSYLPLRLSFLLYNFCKGITPIFYLRCSKDSLGSGSVKMSATYSFVSTYSSLKTFWDTCSLRKWYFIGMCFVLECMIWFFDMFITLVLSKFIIIGCSYFTSKSSSVYSSKWPRCNMMQQKYIRPLLWRVKWNIVFHLTMKPNNFLRIMLLHWYFFDHQYLFPNMHR